MVNAGENRAFFDLFCPEAPNLFGGIGMTITGLVCSSCGAALNPQGNAASIRCPYCDTVNLVRESSQERTEYERNNIVGATSFKVDDPHLHKKIVDVLSMPEMPPLDVYTTCNVKSVTKLMVPAFWFTDVSGMGTAQYEKGMEREYSEIVGSGEDMRPVQKVRTEWFPMSMSVNDTCNFVTAGNNKYDSIVASLFGDLSQPEVVNIESSGISEASFADEFNVNDGDAFNRLVKPAMEKHLKDKAVQILGYSDVRNIVMSGAGIMKGDVKKIMIAVYEVIVEYGGKSHRFYFSGDGNRTAIDTLPEDQMRIERLGSIKGQIDAVKAKSVQSLKILGWILSIFGFITIMAGIGVLLLAGGITLIVVAGNRQKENEAAINSLEAQMQYMYQENNAAKQAFLYDKTALPGVLSGVSGNPDAF